MLTRRCRFLGWPIGVSPRIPWLGTRDTGDSSIIYVYFLFSCLTRVLRLWHPPAILSVKQLTLKTGKVFSGCGLFSWERKNLLSSGPLLSRLLARENGQI
ncbi:unnamed protein product [Meganyctiphanes norvegica]|uniref:Uncharacterized protein n=1 Tax=Meganyctiphanes norvegica TaxID=48144 RepID=A0AAV2SI07_MEGNR